MQAWNMRMGQRFTAVLMKDVTAILERERGKPGRVQQFVPRTDIEAAIRAQGFVIAAEKLTEVRDALVEDCRLVVALWPTGEHWRLKA